MYVREEVGDLSIEDLNLMAERVQVCEYVSFFSKASQWL